MGVSKIAPGEAVFTYAHWPLKTYGDLTFLCWASNERTSPLAATNERQKQTERASENIRHAKRGVEPCLPREPRAKTLKWREVMLSIMLGSSMVG